MCKPHATCQRTGLKTMAEDPATRSAALALQEERTVMAQGYTFLDEKRVLLATEILRRLRDYERREKEYLDQMRSAREAMRAAIGRHGFEGLQVYPALDPAIHRVKRTHAKFLGVPLTAQSLHVETHDTGTGPELVALDPSPEAAACRTAFLELMKTLAELSAEGANLVRLAEEYRRTQKRASALENILLPEIETRLQRVNEHLEATEQEEAVRVRLVPRQGTSAD